MALEGWKKANGDKQAKRETMRKITHLMSLENEIKNHKRAIIRLQGERIEFLRSMGNGKGRDHSEDVSPAPRARGYG